MVRFLSIVLLLAALAAPLAPRPARAADRFFAETGFSVPDDRIWDYFLKRGGVRTFGYPISRPATLLGFRVQFFQRSILQVQPDGSVTSLNLLDPGLMPYSRINGSTYPAPDPAVVGATPPVGAPDYGTRIIEFVRAHAPDEWNGLPVSFYRTFLNTVRLEEAFPEGNGDPGLLPLLALEIWGAPTSAPAYDPNNHNFVYLRFQRGIMHFDATTGQTQGLLLADYLKSLLTGRNLPPDLEAEAQGSRFFRQYSRGRPGSLARPQELPASDLTNAFEREDAPLGPIDYPPDLTLATTSATVALGGTFALTLSATDDLGLRSMTWSADASGDAALDSPHDVDCAGARTCSHTWTLTATHEGDLTIAARATDTTGQDSDQKSLVVRVVNSLRATLERPAAGAKVGGSSIRIAGWAVDTADPTGTGIQAVHVYLDGPIGEGAFLGPAEYGIARPDVAAALGQPRFAGSGFKFVWDASSTPLGRHTLYVYALSRVSGLWAAMSAPIELIALPFPDDPQLFVEAPSPGATLGVTATVAGWAADRNAPEGTGIDAVQVYLDGPMGQGLFLGTASYGQSRPDVAAALGSSRFEQTGFTLTFSTGSLRAGEHLLYVYARSALSQEWTLKTVAVRVP